jgi:TetR/AcrR family transcriptional regulator, regulator of biofilm formation and stress response
VSEGPLAGDAGTGDRPTADPGTDGRRLKGARRREELIDATLRIVARDGVGAVTHRAVAAEAGVPKSAATYHFDSLDALLVAALRSGTEQFVRALPGSGEHHDLDRLLELLVAFVHEHHDQIVARYELYLLAARRPGLRPAVEYYLGVLTELITPHARDVSGARGAAAAFDGYVLQSMVRGVEPDVAELTAIVRSTLR